MRHIADRMRAVAAIAQGFAGLGALDGTAHFDLEFPFTDRQAFDRAALMRVRLAERRQDRPKNHTIAAIRPF